MASGDLLEAGHVSRGYVQPCGRSRLLAGIPLHRFSAHGKYCDLTQITQCSD